MQYEITVVLLIISTAMRLHNFCIDNDGQDREFFRRRDFESYIEAEAFTTWWSTETIAKASLRDNQGARGDLEDSDLRRNLTDELQQRGITRPGLCEGRFFKYSLYLFCALRSAASVSSIDFCFISLL